MRGRIARWRALGAAERRLHLASAAMLGVISPALAVAGLGRVRALLRRFERPTVACRLGPEAIATTVERVGRHLPWRPRCLARAVLVQWLLARRGCASALRIGVRRDADGRLDAHAWVECDGVALGEAPRFLERYAAFDREL